MRAFVIAACLLVINSAASTECTGDSCPATNLAPPVEECTGDSCPATNLAPPVEECTGDSCPATNLAPPVEECTGDSCPATNLAPPPSDDTKVANQPTDSDKVSAAKDEVPPPKAIAAKAPPKPRSTAAGPHVLVVHDSKIAKLEDVLEVFAKLHVGQQVATQLVQRINQKGSSVVVEGSATDCQQVAALFEAISMKTEVRPKRASDTPSEYSDSDVLILDTAGLEEVAQSDTPMLVTFYAPWCGHCRTMVPEFKKAATKLKTSGIATGAVNCDQEKGLAQRLGIKGFHTVKFVYKGRMTDYAGPRQAAELVGFAQGQARVAVLKDHAARLLEGVSGGVKRAVSKLAGSKVLQRERAGAAAAAA